ncbi:MAG: sugar transferase [Dietzia maris]
MISTQTRTANSETQTNSTHRLWVPEAVRLILLEAAGLAATPVIYYFSVVAHGVGGGASETFHPANFVLPVVWIIVLFDPQTRKRHAWMSGLDFYSSVVRTALPAVGIAATVLLAWRVPIHRRFFFACLVFGVLWLIFARLLFRALLKRSLENGKAGQRTVVVFLDPRDADPIGKIVTEPQNGFRLEGWLGDSALATGEFGDRLGSLEDLPRVCRRHRVRRVVANGESVSSETLERVAWELRPVGAQLTLVMDVSYASAPGVEIRNAYGFTVGEVSTPGISGFKAYAKRAFDLLGASIALALLSPVMVLVAIAIAVEDGRPVIFRQSRVGEGLTDFYCLKFRSMVKNAPQKEAELRACLHKPGEMWKVDNDPRVTRVGRWIRATSLDELPQFLNVLRGDMSLVGPRPKQRWELRDYTESQLRRFTVRPGITGLSQVSGRSNLSLDEAVELDLEYLRNWGLVRDFLICLETIRTIFSRTGAR